MTELNSLETMAEISIALTGFTGVVSVLGDRPRGGWVGPDRLFLQALLNWSLIGAILGMFPGVLLSAFDDAPLVWFVSSAMFAAVHFVSLTWFLTALTRLEFKMFRRFERRIITVCIPFAVVLLIYQLGVVAGPWRALAAPVYHFGIFWYLLISGIAFSFMLFPRAMRERSG